MVQDEDGSDNRYEKLKNIEHFRPRALKHIFEGELNGGFASGYHYEGLPNTPGRTIPGTETFPDRNGVYLGKVTVHGIRKRTNGGDSSFFVNAKVLLTHFANLEVTHPERISVGESSLFHSVLLSSRILLCN